MNVSQEDIEHEEEIVWLVHPAVMVYVREGAIITDNGHRPIEGRGRTNVLVGYAALKADTPDRGYFRRRVFWQSKYDRYFQPDGVYSYGTPAEAVDPLTVSPGVAGQQTDRMCGDTSASPRT